VEQGNGGRHGRGKFEFFSPSSVSCRSLTHPCTKNRARSSNSACATWWA
jgi:hypothetical protein